MEPEDSLPQSQVPATCPYSELPRSSLCPHIPLPEDIVNIILPSTSGSFKLSLSVRFPHINHAYASPLTLTCLCERFVTYTFLRWRVFSTSHQPPSWRTTPCQLSSNFYSIYSQLLSILEAVTPFATRGRANSMVTGTHLSRYVSMYVH